jgi:uncharacterized membrane protein
MSTTLPSLLRPSQIRPRYFVFAFVFGMMIYVIFHNESFLWNSQHPAWQHYALFKWQLLVHGLGGACALFLGPLQFSDKLRARYTKFHRVVGRFYVFGALVAAPVGMYMQYLDERVGGTRSFTIATIVDGGLWMSTTLIALIFAMNRKITQHRQWMTRSYAIAIVFLEVRVISGLFGFDGNLAATETIVWSCVAVSLFLADIVIQYQELRRSQPAANKVAQARTAVA